MVEWLSYGLEIILVIIGGLFTAVGGIIAYKHRQTIEEQQDTERWYVDTIKYAQRIQQIREDYEKRSDLQQSDAQRNIEIIADTLSSHCTEGNPLNIDETTYTLAEETVENCREVVRVREFKAITGIKSQLKTADESAEELEQSAKRQL